MKIDMKRTFFLLALVSQFLSGYAQYYKETGRFACKVAKQAVVVDEGYMYAVSNKTIIKYTLSGDSITEWKETEPESIIHMNSGCIIGDLLYCVNSNYPQLPMTSSIEVFDKKTLKHVNHISLGIRHGSCTWAVKKGNKWYAFFAHYANYAQQPGRDVSWSHLVEFDEEWRELQAWVLPEDLIKKLNPCSLSGGLFVGDVLYCTGHDASECYVLALPQRGSTLKWLRTYPVPFPGQAISMDEQGNLWGIDRANDMIIKATFMTE